MTAVSSQKEASKACYDSLSEITTKEDHLLPRKSPQTPVWLTRDQRKQKDKTERNLRLLQLTLEEIGRTHGDQVHKQQSPAPVFFGPPRPPPLSQNQAPPLPPLPPFIVDTSGLGRVFRKHEGVYDGKDGQSNEEVHEARNSSNDEGFAPVCDPLGQRVLHRNIN